MTQMIPFNRGAVRATDAVSQAMSFNGYTYWLFFGVGIVTWVILIFLNFIPLLGIFATPLLQGPLLVGIYTVILKVFDGEDTEFGMMFSGFKKFLPAMIVSLLLGLPTMFFQTIIFFGRIASLFGQGIARQSFLQTQPTPDYPQFFTGTVILVIIVVMIISLIVSLLIYVTFFNAYPLISEHDIGAIQAIVLSAKAGWSNLGGLLLLALFQFLIFFPAAMLCGVGAFFVLPIIYGSTVVAYRQMFPKMQSFVQNKPPPPTEYGDMFGQDA